MDPFSAFFIGMICCGIVIYSWNNNEPALPLYMCVVAFISAFTGPHNQEPYAFVASAILGIVSLILSKADKNGQTSGTHKMGIDPK